MTDPDLIHTDPVVLGFELTAGRMHTIAGRDDGRRSGPNPDIFEG